MYMKLREKKAFTLVEIMIVVAIIGLLVAIAVPNFVRARRQARKNLCINNLRLITHAVEQWAIDTGAAQDAAGPTASVIYSATVTSPPPFIKKDLVCPAGGTAYAIPAVGANAACPDVGTYTEHVLPEELL